MAAINGLQQLAPPKSSIPLPAQNDAHPTSHLCRLITSDTHAAPLVGIHLSIV